MMMPDSNRLSCDVDEIVGQVREIIGRAPDHERVIVPYDVAMVHGAEQTVQLAEPAGTPRIEIDIDRLAQSNPCADELREQIAIGVLTCLRQAWHAQRSQPATDSEVWAHRRWAGSHLILLG